MKKARATCAGQGCGSAKHQDLITPTAPAAQSLQIEHAITLDDMAGQPWPPALGDHWHLVRSVEGRSLWRRVSIKTTGAAK